MEHVVFFPAPDGSPAFRRFAGLDEAVRFVEHLRNVENVSEASVHALTEVPLSFKTWYRVEVPAEGAGQPHAEADADQGVASVAAAAPSVDMSGAAAATIAEAMETYARPTPIDDPFAMPGSGSATGIVVPDQPLVAVDQFTTQPPAGAPVPPALAVPPAAPPVPGRPVSAQTDGEQAQVLEPAFGARRDRGMGFFAR